MTTVVRRATTDDVAALVALRVEMFGAMGVSRTSEAGWRDRAAVWFEQRVDDPAYGLFVVAVGTTVVACAVGAIRDAAPSPRVPEGRDVLISNVCTFPQYRGQGHGKRAFEAVIQWWHESGVARAELMATDSGRGMYERAGFVTSQSPAMRAHI